MVQIIALRRQIYHKELIDETVYSEIVWERKYKLDKIDMLLSEGCLEDVAFEVMEISRATYYRWKRKYKELGLIGLERDSTRPINVRKPTWSQEVQDRVYRIRKKYPLWGKEKLAIKYQDEFGTSISVSTLGRVLARLVAKKLVDPVRVMYGQREIKRRTFDGHSKRWKYGMKSKKPGELVQIDHMTVTIPGYGSLKHFNAICPVTKFSAYQVYHTATSVNATNFLEHVRKTFPFSISSIQVDGGSEFMADFEQTTAKIGIPLFVLPPRRPQLNGGVERGNGTAKYEFYSQYSAHPSFPVIKASLQEFARFYNTVRPHHGIGLLTPAKFYELIKNEVLESHMC